VSVRSSERLDRLLVQKGLVSSRSKARACILAGEVFVNGKRCTKAGQLVSLDAKLELRQRVLKYVSRGGFKLEHALTHFEINVSGAVCMDVGASTGGFTDCLLQHGASKVYAVDVGYGQLDWKLRNDIRVVVLEKENIRYLSVDKVPEIVDIVTIDTSFISLKIVIPSVIKFIRSGAFLVALIKPQFEAGRRRVGKGGVVRDPRVHQEILEEIVVFTEGLGFRVLGTTESPLLGPKGNREFLMAARWTGDRVGA